MMLVETAARAPMPDLVGGRLCLDFVNTVHNYGSYRVRDDVSTYSELVAWSSRAGVLGDAEKRLLSHEALQRPTEAEAAIEEMKRLRDGLYHLFTAIIEGRRADGKDLAILNMA